MHAQPAARRVPVALALLLLVSLAVAAHAADGIFTDHRTGLTWVADTQFAIHAGSARSIVLPRWRALRLVAAMNRGEIRNFGRNDWRLPTRHEVATRAPERAGTPSARDLVVAWPVAGAAALAGIDGVAILATNSAQLAKTSAVEGNVVVNDAAPGATLQSGFELALNAQSQVTGSVAAHRLRLDQGSAVSGDASYDTVQGAGSVGGVRHTPVALPFYSLLPVFHTAAPRAGSPDVVVAPGETRTLPPGDYGRLDVGIHGTLILAGGQYDVRDVVLRDGSGCASPCAVLLFAAATDLRLVERLDAGAASVLAPQAGSGPDASAVIVYVGGINGATGALGATPPAVHFGRGAVLGANVYAPNGSVQIDRDSAVRGALFGRDVRVDQASHVALASFFANRPPVAQPQSVVTNGPAPITIVLTGEDPEGEDLRFSIVSDPTHGTLGPVIEDPAPTGDCSRPVDPDACVPNRTHASVVYTPATGDDLEDSFVFQVRDPAGAVGVATVRINPPGQETPPPPPPDTVVVADMTVNAFRDRAAVITLTGAAPNGVGLVFAVVAGSGPASGTLSAPVPGTESPLRTSSVTYTPASGFVGNDAFQFTACGVVASVTVCDTGNVTLVVSGPTVEPSELAPDLGASTVENRAVQIVLGGSTTGAFAPLRQSARDRVVGMAAFLDGAEIAGNVADADANGLGDNHNPLPGPVPVLVSAGVGQSGGAGSNGTTRVQIEWDISNPGGAFTGASVVLHTERGTVDALDTFFFAGASGNGTLEDADFESALEAAGGPMPVPDLSVQPVGAEGTFSFDVLGPLNAAIAAGAHFFTVQGRVVETSAGPARGLQVHSTASSNLASFLEPQLSLTTPGVTPPPTFTVLSLPLHGVLRDSLGVVIDTVPALLGDARITYTPTTSFSGDDQFSYQAELFSVVESGLVRITVRAGSCATDPEFCDVGR